MKKQKIYYNYGTLLLFMGILFSSSFSVAVDLTNSAVFHRCYAQITQSRVPLASTILTQVKAGTKDPITACLEVFDSAKFISPTYTKINTANAAAKDVLRTMHHVHATWFENQDYIVIGQEARTESTRAALDITAPASYYTKALFDPNMKLSDVLLTTENLSPIRTNMAPTATDVPPTIYYDTFPVGFPFAPVGDILGVYNRTGIKSAAGDVSFTLGAGILGNQAYLMSTINTTAVYSSDGAIKMPRKWARAVYHDLLCRNLPNVRRVDGLPFVDTAADAPFRKSSACVYCHASIDRMSSVIRSVVYHNAGGTEHNADGYFANTVFNVRAQTPIASTGIWLSKANYRFPNMTPASGVLYYRDYQGKLVDQNIADIADLGRKISQSDDFYICAAKRYYQYFTGVDANIGDISDPVQPVALSTAETRHRDIVIQLGLSLKVHQSLRQTIETILRLPAYKKSDFNRGSP